MKLRVSIITALVLILLPVVAYYFYESEQVVSQQKRAEEELFQKLRKAISDRKSEIRLGLLLPENIAEICIQSAYLSKTDFEKGISKTVQGFESGFHDGGLKWWLFDLNNKSLVVEIPNNIMLELPETREPACYVKVGTQIIFAFKSNLVFYKFRRK